MKLNDINKNKLKILNDNVINFEKEITNLSKNHSNFMNELYNFYNSYKFYIVKN